MIFGIPVIHLMFQCAGCNSIYTLNLSVLPMMNLTEDDREAAVEEAKRIMGVGDVEDS
jgi:hypothetical protein